MEKEKLFTLAHKILTHQASDEEVAQYIEWINTLEPISNGLPEDAVLKEAILLTRIQSVINDKHPRRVRRLKWSAIAAALVLLIGLSVYLLIYKDSLNTKNELYPEMVMSEEVSPGGNHAILTLAGGHKVTLDGVGDGKIAEQSGSVVSKKGDGLLAYNSTIESPNDLPAYNSLSTPRGGQYQLILSDGTKVWLNAASSIRYPTSFSGTERMVSVTGEVYFEVTHNATKPFIVSANGMKIQVLGTHFNVNAYADDGITKTTLAEGSIKVIHGKVSKTIFPGEQAAIKKANAEIKVKHVNAADMTAWTRGFLILQGNDVKEFMTQLSRWYNVDIEYKGAIPENVLGGFIGRKNSLSDVLSALKTSGVSAKLEGRKIIVSTK